MNDSDLLKLGWKHVYYLKRKQWYTHDKYPYLADFKAAVKIQKEWDNAL